MSFWDLMCNFPQFSILRYIATYLFIILQNKALFLVSLVRKVSFIYKSYTISPKILAVAICITQSLEVKKSLIQQYMEIR